MLGPGNWASLTTFSRASGAGRNTKRDATCSRPGYRAPGSLLIAKGNDLFGDEELDGLLLPVVYVAVQLVGVHA